MMALEGIKILDLSGGYPPSFGTWMLGDLGYKSAIRPLIDSLEYTYGPATQTIAASLRKLTGKHYGSSYRRWWTWYEAVRRDQ